MRQARANRRDVDRVPPGDTSAGPAIESFAVFMRDAEPRLRRALVAYYGPEAGRDSAAEALAYGWEHWSRVRRMENPVGYLFRIGQNLAKRYHRAGRFREVELRIDPPGPDSEPWCEPGLGRALGGLSLRQRGAVLLVKGYGWTYEEAAQTLGVRRSTVEKHVARGLEKLRKSLGVQHAA
jgi:RNA polymerase sigma-70 factor (ECF subfamily)